MSTDAVATRAWPTDLPELSPLLPLVLSVWMDGVLSDDELRRLQEFLASQPWLSEEATTAVGGWLDPEAPPTPSEIQRLASRLRAVDTAADPQALDSVTDLGLALWRAEGAEACCWSDPEPVEGLRQLEASLEILGAEAARRMARAGDLDAEEAAPAALDTAALAAYLERDHAELRARVRELIVRSELHIEDGLGGDEYRERVLTAVRLLADEGLGRLGYPEEFGGRDDPGAAVAVFETLALGDLSVVVKFGVQFGLFGGSVLNLGNATHHRRFLGDIGSLALPGCYAMTETGHGSNVRDLETTATFDAGARELVVHTPTDDAMKDWIGNAACHGRMATVFARLIVGEEDHGVHAVLVPIRDESGAVLPGVTIEDRGLKVGLNGVDNGRIGFDSVRVPGENLLDRFGEIDAEGSYHSPIQSSGRRFFRMLRTLVAGRVSIAAASISATKVGLTVAVRYAAGRRQFGPKSAPERPILEYPLVQRALLPPLATTLGLHFASRRLQQQYATAGSDDDAEVEVAAAGLKAYASDHCVETLQACREACGGQGYLAANRFAALKADTDIFTTFEGANDVLYQLMAKGLLSAFRDHMGHLNLWTALRYLGERAETRITELNPVVVRRTELDHLTDHGFLGNAMEYREQRLLRSAALRMRSRLRDGMDSFKAVTEVQDHLVALSRAHVERTVFEAFSSGAAEAPEESIRAELTRWCTLYGLSRIEADRGWFLEAGYLEANKSRAIRSAVAELCDELRHSAVSVVDAFAVPEPLLPDLVRRP